MIKDLSDIFAIMGYGIMPWIQAARLRTLPLAIATMIVGHALAYGDGRFSALIFWLSMVTAIALQILSNFANDYGDSIHGADHDGRQGPMRGVQSGVISMSAMRRAMYGMSSLAWMLGVGLTLYSFDDWGHRAVFIGLASLAVWAAINYTAGSRPYGYRGQGDIAVFVFFGLVTVLGSYYLQVAGLGPAIVLPAISCGLLSVAVLNVNNIRDIESDRIAGKMSIPVQIGRDRAVLYHGLLLIVAVVCLVAYHWYSDGRRWDDWLFLLGVPLLVINWRAVYRITESVALDPYLKQLALSVAATLILFAIGLIL